MTPIEPGDVAEALALDIPDDLDTEPLRIPDQRVANRALRRLAILQTDQATVVADAEAELAELFALIEPERQRIAAFMEDRLHGIERARSWTLRGLEGWMRAANTADPSLVTVKGTGGELRLRKNPDRIVITDQTCAADALPSTVKPVEVQPAEVKKLVKPSGIREDAEQVDPLGIDVPDGFHVECAVNGDGQRVDGVFFLVPDGKRFEWEAS